MANLGQVMKAMEYADNHPNSYLKGTTNWCAAVAYSLNQQMLDELPESRRIPPPRHVLQDDDGLFDYEKGFNDCLRQVKIKLGDA